MKEILCSAFSSNVIVNANIFNHFLNSHLKVGYIGTSDLKLISFIKSNKEATHIVFSSTRLHQSGNGESHEIKISCECTRGFDLH